MLRNSVLLMVVLLFVGSNLAFAQDVPPPGLLSGRPPLVECVEGEAIPCVEIVDAVDDIVGVWRRYFAGAAAMAFTIYAEDGSVRMLFNPEGESALAGTIAFEDGLAQIAAAENSGVQAECITPGTYEVRLIRLGEQPVALTFLQIEDDCPGRINDLSQPMLYYTGAEVAEQDANIDVLVQSLVPCPDEVSDDEAAYPCDVVATSPQDIAGVWRQYIGNPAWAPDGAGYIRYNSDGGYSLANSVENSLTPYEDFPFGTVSFDGSEMTFTVDSQVPPGCEIAVYSIRVIRVGNQPVALNPIPVTDECVRRREGDMAEALIWISAAEN